MMKKNSIEFYQSDDGQLKIDVHVDEDTVWLTQVQMADLFGRAKGTISEHISNIFEEGELIKEEATPPSLAMKKITPLKLLLAI